MGYRPTSLRVLLISTCQASNRHPWWPVSCRGGRATRGNRLVDLNRLRPATPDVY